MDSSEAVAKLLPPRVLDNKAYRIWPTFRWCRDEGNQAMKNRRAQNVSRIINGCRGLVVKDGRHRGLGHGGQDSERDDRQSDGWGSARGSTCGCPGSSDRFGIYQESCTRASSVTLLCLLLS